MHCKLLVDYFIVHLTAIFLNSHLSGVQPLHYRRIDGAVLQSCFPLGQQCSLLGFQLGLDQQQRGKISPDN